MREGGKHSSTRDGLGEVCASAPHGEPEEILPGTAAGCVGRLSGSLVQSGGIMHGQASVNTLGWILSSAGCWAPVHGDTLANRDGLKGLVG